MVEIDPDFIQAPEHRRKPVIIEAENIPVIDLSPILDNNIEKDPLAFDDLVEKIGSACKEWGFFQVINHGVPLEVRERFESVGKKFFGQKMEEKKKVRRDLVNVLGYYESELTKNVRDWKEVFDVTFLEPT